MIFIQVAAYQDPQLLPTINDAIKKAQFPDNLVFGIVDQSPTPLTNLPSQCRYMHIDSKHSRGVCWARHLANTLYHNEEYFMQIDSHMRFDEGWDTILINQLVQLKANGYPKPVLTCYPNMYWLDEAGNDVYGTKGRTNVTIAVGWNNDMLLLAPGPSVTEFKNSLVVAGGFIFTTGDFISVQYDPKLYFLGEEIILTVQAFTRGYDMVHPANCPIYHFYTRTGAIRHWSDHADWHITNTASETFIKNALRGNTPSYFGNLRTLQDYEHYSGISFTNLSLNNKALKGL